MNGEWGSSHQPSDCLLHQGIDLLNGGVLLSSEGQVHHGDVRGGHAWEDTGRSGGERMPLKFVHDLRMTK